MESYLMNTPNNFKKFAQNSKSRDFAKCPRARHLWENLCDEKFSVLFSRVEVVIPTNSRTVKIQSHVDSTSTSRDVPVKK